jgi:ArsR family metal-binding transcriptional regulator
MTTKVVGQSLPRVDAWDKNDDILLRSFRITHVLDCIADPTKNRVIAEFSDNIAAVFPYLNAILPNLMYNPEAETVTMKREWRLLTFYPHVAVMAKVDGAEDAIAQLTWFQQLCNDTWSNRQHITPRHEVSRLLGPLDVYVLLPKLNCHACGEATCMAFAFELLLGGRKLPECPRLQEPEHASGAQRLRELLGAEPPAVHKP